MPADARTPAVIDIGSRRELFVDGFLVGRLAGKAELRLHHPVPIFKDGDLYKGVQIDPFQEADPHLLYNPAKNQNQTSEKHKPKESP